MDNRIDSLRGSNEESDLFAHLVPRNYYHYLRAVYLEERINTFPDMVEEKEDFLSWENIGKCAGSTFALGFVALIVGWWLTWIIFAAALIVTLLCIGLRFFVLYKYKMEHELRKIANQALLPHFGFENIARHFALKEDADNYNAYVDLYADLLRIGSNDENTRAGQEKVAIVNQWVNEAVEISEKALSPVEVEDELNAEQLRKMFGENRPSS